jgi:hypothetical protein
MYKRNLDDSALRGLYLASLTVLFHKIAGGFIPNLFILFLIWLIFTAIFYFISNRKITWQKTLFLSMISQPFLHIFFDSGKIKQISCASVIQSHHVGELGQCSTNYDLAHHSSYSGTLMILSHLFAILLIQLFSLITTRTLKVVFYQIKAICLIALTPIESKIFIDKKIFKNFSKQINLLIRALIILQIGRRGPPLLK